MALQCARAIRTVLGFALCVCALIASAQNAELPGIDELQRRVEAVEQAEELSAADKDKISEGYKSAIDRMRAADRLDEEARRYAQSLIDLPQERARFRAELEEYRPPEITPELKMASPGALEQNVAKQRGEVAALRTRLEQLQAALQTERRMALQQLISEAQQAAQSASDAQPPALMSEQAKAAASIARAAERRLQQSRIEALGQRLASRPARIELMEAEINLLEAQLKGAEAYLTSLSALADERRQSSTEQMVREFEAFAATLESAPDPLQRLAQSNVFLAEALNELSEKQRDADAQLARVKADVTSLDAKFQALNRLLELEQFEPSSVFGSALRQEWDRAEQTTQTGAVGVSAEQQLTASRVALFHLDERRPPFDVPTMDSLWEGMGPATEQWAPTITRLMDQQRKLIAELTNGHAQYIDQLSALLTNLRYLAERSTAYSQLLESNLFWIPSAKPIGLETLAAAGRTVSWLGMPSHWQSVLQSARANVADHPLKIAFMIALLAVTMVKRRAMKRRLAEMKTYIGKVSFDRFQLTLEAYWITALLALPEPLLLFTLAQLTSAATGFPASFSRALTVGALVLIFMEFMRQVVRKDGLAEVHFRVRPTTLAFLRRNNRWLSLIIVPIVVVMVLLNAQATPEIRDGLGRIALLVLCFALAVFGARIVQRTRLPLRVGAPRRWYAVYLGYPALFVVPLVLIGLSMLGYHYSAKQLLGLLLQTIAVITVAMLVYYTLVRAFMVYERRLALERIREKRAAANARNADRDAADRAAESVPDTIDDQEIDRHTMTTQTNAVIRLLVWGGAIVAVAAVWHNLLPIVRSLDGVIVWQTAADTAGVVQGVTLWSLLSALTVLAVSLIAVRNLPGVLEVAILSRMDLAPGTGYAVTTVLKYTIVLGGVLTVANMLGADWSKLQWLVAALSVGLGFGLQEIVANFVSGIVILFEKPFRLGDTVTIEGQTGTVTRIRIRATTISDWDRKELIIPNKSFITKNFINWTLSDSITRVVVPVGVAFGADTEKVLSCLVNVARENEHVYDDPPPAALFVGFGASTLNFELRVFAGSLLDRVIIAHDLHMAINARFREQGIEIAFPQRDMHVDSRQPIEVVIKPPTGEAP